MDKKKAQREKAKAAKESEKEEGKPSKTKPAGGALRGKNLWMLMLGVVSAPVLVAVMWPRSLRVVAMQRVPLEAMTVDRFLSEFSAQKPVVVTGAWPEDGWSPEQMASACQHARIRTFRHDTSSSEWGKLVQVGVEALQDYVGVHFARNLAERPRPRLYGFEMALKFHCPERLEAVRVPSFLCEDAFHVATNHTGLGWPSVLLGPEGSETGLHIDTHRLPFWIAVVGDQQRVLKRFRVFPHDDRGILQYGRPSEKANYLFDFDPWKPNFGKHPLVADSFVYEAELRSGDLLYIPGGSPHAVINLADNTGISMNYLDLKSFPDFVRKVTPSSPLYHVLKGAGEGLIGALEDRRKVVNPMNYFEFAGVRDRTEFCQVHQNTMDDGKRPAGLAAYCDT